MENRAKCLGNHPALRMIGVIGKQGVAGIEVLAPRAEPTAMLLEEARRTQASRPRAATRKPGGSAAAGFVHAYGR